MNGGKLWTILYVLRVLNALPWGTLATIWNFFSGGRGRMPRKRTVEERLKEAADRMSRLRDEQKMAEIRDRMAKRGSRRRRK
jgi:hypothetical protein